MFQLRLHRTQSPGSIAYWTLGFLFLVGMHYIQSHPAGDGLQSSFNAFAWIPLSIAIGAGLFQIVVTSKYVSSSLTGGLAIAIGLLGIPLLYPGSEALIDLGRFYQIAGGLLLFIALQQLKLDDSKQLLLFLFVLLSIWIEALLGWSQFALFGPDNFMGFDPQAHRPYGVFRQPNVMASFMATGLVLSAYLLVRLRLKSTRHDTAAAICLFTPLLLAPLLIALNSRVGWLGATVGILLVLPYLHAQLGRRMAVAWFALLLLGFLVGLLLLESTDGWTAAATKLQTDPNRSFIFPQVLRMLLENPLFGVGYGNFEASYNLFAADLYAAGITENAGYPNLHHPHNELLFWGAEGGIIALGALLFAAFLVLKAILRAPAGHRMVLVGLFFPIVLHTQTEYPFYHSVAHWVVFVLLIYLVDSIGNTQKERKLGSTLLIGTAGIVIPLVTSIFMITTLHAGAILTKYEQVEGTSVETLLNIVNPIVWQERIRWELGSALMYAGLTQGDVRPALSFIEVIRNSLEKKPRWQNYQDLIFSYEFIRDRESAEAVLEEAQYRYPDINFYRESDGNLVILQYSNRDET